MKNFIIGFIVVVAILALNSDFMGGRKIKRFSVTADTNVSQVKGLSKYVTQQEIDGFALRHWNIDTDKVMNNDKMENLRLLLKSQNTQEILAYMKDNNISADEPLHYGVTALMYASFYDDINTAKELINLGADPHKKDRHKLSPMAYAIENNATKSVKLLLENGVKFDEVGLVQFYLKAPTYYDIDLIILDDNGTIELTYNHKYGETPYEINEKTGEKRFTGGGGLYFFAYLVRENLYDIAKMALESGYKPYMFHSNNTVYEDTRYANSMQEMLSEEEFRNKKGLSEYEYRCSLYERLENKADYKFMLRLLLDYNLTYTPTSSEFLKEEYERCHRKYQDLIHDKISYLYNIVNGKDEILQDYLVYKYAKEKGLKAKKLENELDRKNQYANPYDYILRKLKENNTIVKLELKPNPYIIEYYDSYINLYGKYCGDANLNFKVDFENFNKEELIKFYQNFHFIKPDENLRFKNVVEYIEYKNKERDIQYTSWFEYLHKYANETKYRKHPNHRLILKDKNMTYFEYTEKYKKGEIVLDENSFIDKRLKSAKTEDEKQFFGISNIDREEVFNLKKEFYEYKF